jgi:uncharacterized protein YuzB (UPF0349 family)
VTTHSAPGAGARRRPYVEYCISNVDAAARAALLRSGLLVEETSCLQRCGQCFAGPFVVVDGDLIDGSSHAAILERLRSDPCH